MKDERRETELCFTSGEASACLVAEHVCYGDGLNTFCLNSSVVWVQRRLTTNGGGEAEEQLLSPGSGCTWDHWEGGPECVCVFNAGDLTWFLVCCCALSLLLGCRGVSLGMGPIGVGCMRRKQTEAVNRNFQEKIKPKRRL